MKTHKNDFQTIFQGIKEKAQCELHSKFTSVDEK